MLTNQTNLSNSNSATDQFINYAESETKLIANELNKIESELKQNMCKKVFCSSQQKIVNIEKKIENIVKVLKRSIKGENDIENLERINTPLTSLNKTYNAVIEQLKLAEHSLPKQRGNTDIRVKQISRILFLLGDVKARAANKMEIIRNKASFEGSQLPRFDRLNEEAVNFKVLGSIIEKIQLKNHPITASEYLWLKDLLAKPDIEFKKTLKATDVNEFRSFIKELINEIEAAGKRKHNLLGALLKEVEEKEPLDKEDKLKYTIQCHQILRNPFEIPLEVDYHRTEKSLKDIFNTSELEYKLESRISEITLVPHLPCDENILKYKLEGLKKIREEYKKENLKNPEGETLISGAGPGGLMFGLIASLHGKNFSIIESRKENDSTARNNILALGKEDDEHCLKMLGHMKGTGSWDEGDLKLLDFFGVTDKLLSQEKAHKKNLIEPGAVFNAKIGDLQKTMLENLQVLENTDKPVVAYETRIEKIESGEKGQPAKVKLTGEETMRTPSVVYVMEGYRTTTRSLLGIDVLKQSKATLIGFSFFEARKEGTFLEEFLQKMAKVIDLLGAIPGIFKIVSRKIFPNPDSTNIYKDIFKTLGRGELLLKTPETEYFYFTLSKNETKKIKEYKTALAHGQKGRDKWTDTIELFLKDNKEKLSSVLNNDDYAFLTAALKKSNRREWYNDPVKIQKVFEKLQVIANALSSEEQKEPCPFSAFQKEFTAAVEEALTAENLYNQMKNKIGKNIAGPGHVYHSFIGSTDRDPELSYKESDMAFSQVQRAETNYKRMGSTHFYVGGDAESTTDPVSGAGFRTTILRSVIASASFDHPNLRDNSFMQSAFAWGSHRSSQSMREEGLGLRTSYMSGTERLERYIDIAEEKEVLTPSDRDFLLNIEGKVKNIREFRNQNLKLNDIELKKLEEIESKISEQYKSKFSKSRCIEDPGILYYYGNELSAKEQEVLLQGWKMIKNNNIEPRFDIKKFKKAIGKLAGSDYPETWYLPLMIEIQRFKTA
jgi:hypothetical protein